MKLTQKRAVYFKRAFNILINAIFVLLVIIIALTIYNIILFIIRKIPSLNNYIGNFITAFVTIALAIVSYLSKMKVWAKKLLYKVKQKIYIFLSIRNNWLLSGSIENYNINKLYGTTEQFDVIKLAINILKNNKQNVLLISGFAGKGKTTTLMLLMDVIAHDKELYDLFIELQHHTIYYDSIKDFEQLSNYLNHPENQRDTMVIIDNIQKYTIAVLNNVISKIINMVTYFHEEGKKILFILMYQNTTNNKATYEYIKNTYFNNGQSIFNLDQVFNLERKKPASEVLEFQQFIININKLNEGELLKYHLENVLNNCTKRKFVKFYNQLLFSPSDQTYDSKSVKKVYVLACIVFICYYYGYITRKTLLILWNKEYKNPLSLSFIIKGYVHDNILIPFPFIHSAYIFNEQLARQYKKLLSVNYLFTNIMYSIAEYMFTCCENGFINMKWLFFISCSPEFCSQYSQEERINLFENALNTYHLQYILDIAECEISIIPEKERIFRQELGILYIYNGEWEKSKKILYPYINENGINKDIWNIQLKIIEAEHGCADENNLEMLNYMKDDCTDPIILFQIDYWREHILMEHGTFSLDTWKELLNELKTSRNLSQLCCDKHFVVRIVSDLERTYFLTGNINYSEYKYIQEQYSFFKGRNTDLIESLLSKAYYIQYDILFQLGIWGCIEYPNIDSKIIDEPILTDCNNTIEVLITQAIAIYDICINKYQSAGKKKYRTLQVRRAELTLCMDSNQYISVLNQYNEFQQYSKQNNISVFEGYCNTQKGKAFILYAVSEFQKGNFEKFCEFMDKALTCLMNAKEKYNEFGNVYGELRAEFLLVFVNMIQDRNHINSQKYIKKYEKKFLELLSKYNISQYYIREYNIISYVIKNITKINLPINIIRYYPIILQ